MKFTIFVWITTLLLTILPACDGTNRSKKEEMNPTTYEPMHRNRQTDTRLGKVRSNEFINGEERLHGGGQNEIGYFRYNPANYPNRGTAGPDIFIDRPLLAENISYLVTVLPNVKEATTLVTDDHIFIGVQPKNGTLDAETVRETKRTAESVTPRYYQIHVTLDQKLQAQIDSVGMRMRDSSNVEGVRGDLEQLLRNMGDDTPPDVNESIHPQGRHPINPTQR